MQLLQLLAFLPLFEGKGKVQGNKLARVREERLLDFESLLSFYRKETRSSFLPLRSSEALHRDAGERGERSEKSLAEQPVKRKPLLPLFLEKSGKSAFSYSFKKSFPVFQLPVKTKVQRAGVVGLKLLPVEPLSENSGAAPKKTQKLKELHERSGPPPYPESVNLKPEPFNRRLTSKNFHPFSAPFGSREPQLKAPVGRQEPVGPLKAAEEISIPEKKQPSSGSRVLPFVAGKGVKEPPAEGVAVELEEKELKVSEPDKKERLKELKPFNLSHQVSPPLSVEHFIPVLNKESAVQHAARGTALKRPERDLTSLPEAFKKERELPSPLPNKRPLSLEGRSSFASTSRPLREGREERKPALPEFPSRGSEKKVKRESFKVLRSSPLKGKEGPAFHLRAEVKGKFQFQRTNLPLSEAEFKPLRSDSKVVQTLYPPTESPVRSVPAVYQGGGPSGQFFAAPELKVAARKFGRTDFKEFKGNFTQRGVKNAPSPKTSFRSKERSSRGEKLHPVKNGPNDFQPLEFKELWPASFHYTVEEGRKSVWEQRQLPSSLLHPLSHQQLQLQGSPAEGSFSFSHFAENGSSAFARGELSKGEGRQLNFSVQDQTLQMQVSVVKRVFNLTLRLNDFNYSLPPFFVDEIREVIESAGFVPGRVVVKAKGKGPYADTLRRNSETVELKV